MIKKLALQSTAANVLFVFVGLICTGPWTVSVCLGSGQ